MDAILARHQSLGIRTIEWKCVVDPFHDSSPEVVELLRPFRGDFRRGVVIRDFEGSGWETRGRQHFEAELLTRLVASGWEEGSCAVIAAEPELESWLRMESPHMAALLKDRARRHRNQLIHWRGNLASAVASSGGVQATGKPKRPKEAFHALLRHYAIPPAGELFAYLGARESLINCTVDSFVRFVRLIQTWYARDHAGESTAASVSRP